MGFFLMQYENQYDKISYNVELIFKFAKIDKCQLKFEKNYKIQYEIILLGT